MPTTENYRPSKIGAMKTVKKLTHKYLNDPSANHLHLEKKQKPN